MSYLNHYLKQTAAEEGERSSAAIAFTASLDAIHASSPPIARAIVQELKDQRTHLKLIASENFCSLPVQLAMGNLLTDKYSEGVVFHRFYAGCDNVDLVEAEAMKWAKKVFGADHAYVQPHSGIDANLVAMWAILVQKVQNKEVERLSKKKLEELTPEEGEAIRRLMMGQKVMGMGLSSGGHLTHGYRHNVSSKMMQAVSYEVDLKTGLLDYHALQKQVERERPLILIAGYSSYPRLINFAKMRQIADSVGAVLMVDMAHFAGLVAGKALQGEFDPIPFAHIVTSTTHKTLRGPRGGFILCQEEFKEAIDKGCPLFLGGPLPHVMAAKAIAFQEASTPAFATYARRVIENAQALADELQRLGIRVITGGTDNHLVVLDVETSFGLTGRQAETLLREARLTVNRNVIPQDPHGAWYTSGVRMGSAALTTLGMGEEEMRRVAQILHALLKEGRPMMDEKAGVPSKARAHLPNAALHRAQQGVAELLQDFPLYPEIKELFSVDENCASRENKANKGSLCL